MRHIVPLIAAAVVHAGCASVSSGLAAGTGGVPAKLPGSVDGDTAAQALAAGEATLSRADWKAAEAHLARAEQLDPRAPRPGALRAEAVLRQGRFAEALAVARTSLAKGETFEARLVEGRVLGAQRRFEAAASAFERCAALDPRSAEAWSALSGARLALGEQGAAERAYAELARLVPPLEAEDRLWTDVLRMQPDPAQIQEALDRCARGTAAYMAGKLAEARYEQVVVLGTVGTYAHCWSELGKTSWKLGALDEAEQAFRRALASYRPDQDVLRGDSEGLLAALLVERGGDPAEAVALARRALSARGDRAETLRTLARACEGAKDPACAADAAARLEKAGAAPAPIPAAAAQGGPQARP